jgi:hypothetical protein
VCIYKLSIADDYGERLINKGRELSALGIAAFAKDSDLITELELNRIRQDQFSGWRFVLDKSVYDKYSGNVLGSPLSAIVAVICDLEPKRKGESLYAITCDGTVYTLNEFRKRR